MFCKELIHWKQSHHKIHTLNQVLVTFHHINTHMGAGQSSSTIKDGFCFQTLRLNKPRPITAHQQSQAQTDVSLRIATHVAASEGKDTNMVLSTLLIHVALSLIGAGSSGPTRQQMLSFLGSGSVDGLNRTASELVTVTLADGSSGGGPKMCMVNGVWVDRSVCLKEGFKHVVDHVYKAACQHVDFRTKALQVTKDVNSWVERNTNGLIKELIPQGSVDSTTRMIVANALYFKGAWKYKFDPSRTRELNFYTLHGKPVKASFMTTKSDQYISTYSNFKVLRLCYDQGSDKNRQFSMLIFLPNTTNDLPSLHKKISSEPNFIRLHLPELTVEVGNFLVPRFKFSFGFEASKTLKQLGLTLPFSNPDLTEMMEIGGEDVRVSRVFHKAFIEVNEEGTEAAGASASTVVLESLDIVDFVADHPFVFVIREDVSGVVLFVGHVMNPNNT